MKFLGQTLKQGFGEICLMSLSEELAQNLRSQLMIDYPDQNWETRESIIRWLLGEDLERFAALTPPQLTIAKQAMDYRYRILRHRYLGVGPERAYRNLTQRLGSLVLLRNKIRTWVALSRDRQRAVVDVLQEVIQELLHSDRYIQQQIAWIAQCSEDSRLRNALLMSSIEEYCLRPIRNQPLLVYRFVNYLRRSQRGGMTHVPEGELVRLVSDEISTDEDNPVSLLDSQAVAQYQDNQAWEEQQALRSAVRCQLEDYLAAKVSEDAAEWLRLYLQGKSQETIAQALNKEIKYVYRLREKVTYHAIHTFAIKNNPELVANWLQTSLQEHSLGLTPKEWQKFWDTRTDFQRQLLGLLKAGKTQEAIAAELNLKVQQVTSEWSKLYLAAHDFRSDS